MKSFASVIVFSAAVVGLVAAQPSLQTRTSCKSNEFWYGERSCCLEHGGPPSPPTPPRSRGCPKDTWYWNNHQGCCVPRHPDPPQPTCGQGYNWSRGSWCCEENPSHTASPPAHPSQAPGQGGYGGGQGGYGGGQGGHGGSQGGYGGGQGGYGGGQGGHRGGQGGYGGGQGGYGGGQGGYGGGQGGYGRGGYKHKRSHTKRTDTLCPTGFSACPINGAKPLGSSSDYDCVDPLEDLRACGGCPTTGEGRDCTKIAHSWNVACVSGGCEVYSCAPGYEVSFDGKTCIPL